MMNTFATGLNEQVKTIMATWWNGLSKQQLLDYIAAQDNITADDVRSMFSNMNGSLMIGVEFNTASNDTQLDFGTDVVDEVE